MYLLFSFYNLYFITRLWFHVYFSCFKLDPILFGYFYFYLFMSMLCSILHLLLFIFIHLFLVPFPFHLYLYLHFIHNSFISIIYLLLYFMYLSSSSTIHHFISHPHFHFYFHRHVPLYLCLCLWGWVLHCIPWRLRRHILLFAVYRRRRRRRNDRLQWAGRAKDALAAPWPRELVAVSGVAAVAGEQLAALTLTGVGHIVDAAIRAGARATPGARVGGGGGLAACDLILRRAIAVLRRRRRVQTRMVCLRPGRRLHSDRMLAWQRWGVRRRQVVVLARAGRAEDALARPRP